MIIKQISVFVENSHGRLSEIINLLAQKNIDLRALSIADTTDFGILRIIVENPQEVAKYLKDCKVPVSITDVISVRLSDEPGALAKILSLLAQNDISIEYLYAFVTKQEGNACVVIRVENNDKTSKLLKEHGYSGINEIA